MQNGGDNSSGSFNSSGSSGRTFQERKMLIVKKVDDLRCCNDQVHDRLRKTEFFLFPQNSLSLFLFELHDEIDPL